MHIDVCPAVIYQFDNCGRYRSAKPGLAIIESIQRIAHLPSYLHILRSRVEPFPILYLRNDYLTRYSAYFIDYLDPIADKMQHMNDDRAIKCAVPKRQVLRVSLN